MLGTLLLIIHIVVAVLICIVILMQSAKGEGLSGAFGLGQGTTSFFGADTANVLVKITTVLAVVFMLTSLSLAYYQAQHARSVTRSGRTPTASSMAAPPGGKEEATEAAEGEQPAGETPKAEEPAGTGTDQPATGPQGGEATGGATSAGDEGEAGTPVEPGQDQPVEPGPDKPADPPGTGS
jgi:preprotein translocase subunit SecG